MVGCLAGCTPRSISDSGYRDGPVWGRSESPLYRGELSELDILGAVPRSEATETNIARALASAKPPERVRGEKIILIQSGALVPDEAMLEEAGRCFSEAPFSGVPPRDSSVLPESLRFRAAQGGCRHIICYWGVLESSLTDREGKTISWAPILGGFVPDERQRMRIRLKALALDVATGGWRMVTPEVYSDDRLSSRRTREVSDQRSVRVLKQRGYRKLMEDLVGGLSGPLPGRAPECQARPPRIRAAGRHIANGRKLGPPTDFRDGNPEPRLRLAGRSRSSRRLPPPPRASDLSWPHANAPGSPRNRRRRPTSPGRVGS